MGLKTFCGLKSVCGPKSANLQNRNTITFVAKIRLSDNVENVEVL